MSVSLEQRSDNVYALKLDQATTNVAYIGEAQIATPTSSPNWRIRKLDTTTGVDIKWADGNANYDNIWDDHITLTYI